MKKSLILGSLLFVSVANADLLGNIGGAIETGSKVINQAQEWWKLATGYYEEYFNKFDKLTFGVVSKCYNIPQPTDLNVCSYIPDIDDIGVIAFISHAIQ